MGSGRPPWAAGEFPNLLKRPIYDKLASNLKYLVSVNIPFAVCYNFAKTARVHVNIPILREAFF